VTAPCQRGSSGGGHRHAHTDQEKEIILVDPAAGTREAVTDLEFAGKAGGFLDVESPDGRYAVFRRGHDLWIRTQEDGRERPLTTDGEADYEYGTGPDAMKPNTILRVLGIPDLPPAIAWSPDSARVLAHRTDQRGVREVHWVEARPADGSEPALHTKRYAYPGDDRVPLAELVVLHAESGAMVRAEAEPLVMPPFSPIQWRWAWWAEDGSAVYYLQQPRDFRTLRLNRMDPETGEVTTVLSESGRTRVEPNQYMGAPPMVRVLGSGREVLWYSQRDGWGHLYLYDARTGTLKNQVTSGDWAVREILWVDEAERVVYFTASGLVPEDPYRRSVCRAGLDGGGFAKVVGDELDHVVSVPDGPERAAYFVDCASAVETAPVITVRGWDGRVLVELERADPAGPAHRPRCRPPVHRLRAPHAAAAVGPPRPPPPGRRAAPGLPPRADPARHGSHLGLLRLSRRVMPGPGQPGPGRGRARPGLRRPRPAGWRPPDRRRRPHARRRAGPRRARPPAG
jgi:hypothetical protein